MRHFATPDFWNACEALPAHVRRLADNNYRLLKANERHPSLHLERVGRFWSVRVGRHYRALGVDAPDGVVWFRFQRRRAQRHEDARQQFDGAQTQKLPQADLALARRRMKEVQHG